MQSPSESQSESQTVTAREGPKRTLGAVIELLPASCYENPTWKGLAYTARDLAVYAIIVWALIQVDHPLLLIPLWILSALAISALFILGHDSAHGALFQSDRLNYLVGQLSMLPSLHLFSAWVFGHNRLHHGHTVRQEMDFVWHPVTPEQYRALSRGQKLKHRIEWSALGAGLYYLIEVYWKRMIYFTPPEKIRGDVRRDLSIVLGFFAVQSALLLAVGFAGGGGISGALWMWTKVFFVPWIVWNYTIGALVYVHHIDDVISWHARRAWTKYKGQVEGTTIFLVPAWLNFFLHNIMVHVPHHVDTRIPFYGLPAAARIIGNHFSDAVRERRLGLREYLRATRSCKLYDFERGQWLDYAAASALPEPISI